MFVYVYLSKIFYESITPQSKQIIIIYDSTRYSCHSYLWFCDQDPIGHFAYGEIR